MTQIADGENGGVMMNEFPGKYIEVVREASGSDVPLMNATEYLEHLFAWASSEADLPEIQPLYHDRIWERMQPGDGPERLDRSSRSCEGGRPLPHGRRQLDQQHLLGAGLRNVLGPMEEASALFNDKVTRRQLPTDERRYRNALFHLLASQTSCYRYWGQGHWTDYGREICRRAGEILTCDY